MQNDYSELAVRERVSALMGWTRWPAGRNAIGSFPQGVAGEEASEIAYISNLLAGFEAAPNSRIWKYRETLAAKNRKSLPHEHKAARFVFMSCATAFAGTCASFIPLLPDSIRWAMLALTGTMTIITGFDWIFPVQGRFIETIKGLLIAIFVMTMFPLAHWFGTLSSNSNSPHATAKPIPQMSPRRL